MLTVLAGVAAAALATLTALIAYQWALLLVSLLPRRRTGHRPARMARFLVLVPAHDEERTLPLALESLARLTYPRHLVRVVVVADRCSDRTAAVARAAGADCLERRQGRDGKGAAIAWALEWLDVEFDALVILDADTTADPGLLEAFEDGLRAGCRVQQGFSYIANPWQSRFTRVIAVTQLLRTRGFYGAKSRLGLSSMLIGTGMCFRRDLLRQYGWPAFTVSEDLEFGAFLLLHGERVHFNEEARVFQRESTSLGAASTQRLRWASGRYAVIWRYAGRLIAAGRRARRLDALEAGLTLLAPPYSTQAILTILAAVGLWLVRAVPPFAPLATWALALLGALAGYFLLGAALTPAPGRTLAGLLLVPVFLPWRLAIELAGLLGYGRSRWLPTRREAGASPTSRS